VRGVSAVGATSMTASKLGRYDGSGGGGYFDGGEGEGTSELGVAGGALEGPEDAGLAEEEGVGGDVVALVVPKDDGVEGVEAPQGGAVDDAAAVGGGVCLGEGVRG
jgi:hypothetical protein